MSLIIPDSGLIIWMTLIFGIVFFILARFGFPAITNMVDERAKRINESIAKAKEAEERIENLAKEQAALLESTRAEQSRMLKEAAQTRAEIVAKAEEEAREKAAVLIEKARTEIAAEKESALRDIRSEVALLSVKVAERVVRRELSEDAGQMAYLNRLVDEMAGDGKENS